MSNKSSTNVDSKCIICDKDHGVENMHRMTITDQSYWNTLSAKFLITTYEFNLCMYCKTRLPLFRQIRLITQSFIPRKQSKQKR